MCESVCAWHSGHSPGWILRTWVRVFSRVRLSTTPWTVVHQALLSMGFSSKEYWSGLPFPPPGDLPDPGIKPSLLHLLLWLGYLNGGGGAPFTKLRFLISLKSTEDLITHGPSLLEPSRNRPFGGHVLLPHHLLSPHIHTH